MTKKVIDYSNTIIYKIICNNPEVTNTYVGHTTNFKKRMATHKSNCLNQNTNKYNLKIYNCIRANGGWINWSMLEIETIPCETLNQATTRERYWLEHYKADLNAYIPNISLEEKKEYQIKWRNDNIEKSKAYQKEWRSKHKNYFVEWRAKNQNYYIEWFQKNKLKQINNTIQ